MLKLLAGSYLVVVTESKSVGSCLGHPIFKINALKVLPCDHSLKNSPEEQKKMESEFSRLLSVAERTNGLYFSYKINLTLSAQRLHDLGDESKLLPLWRQAEPTFLWNNYMLEVLIDNKLDQFLLPVIQGNILFVSVISLPFLLSLNGSYLYKHDMVKVCCPPRWFIEWLVNSGPGSKKKLVDESMVDLIISHCNAFFEPFPEQDHKRVANIEAYSRCCNVIEEMGKKLWALPYSHDEHSKLMEVLGSTRLEVSEWKQKYEETLDENGVRYHKPASSINENVLKYLVDFPGRQMYQELRLFLCF